MFFFDIASGENEDNIKEKDPIKAAASALGRFWGFERW
jgi:hypothetical protein